MKNNRLAFWLLCFWLVGERLVLLVPFYGCETTFVAAEKLKRQSVGIDIWPKVLGVVVDRLEQ